MTEKEKSYDGGLSRNIVQEGEYEKDFIEINGYEKWTTYRKLWGQYCNLEKEEQFPPHLEFELNYSCNLRCPMCTWSMEKAAERKEDWFSFEDYKKLLSDAVSKGTKSIRLTYINEPLIRKDIDQFVKYASDIGVIDIMITTNGTLLTKEMSKKLIEAGITKIFISLDAMTEETYNKIRVGGDFKTTIKNIHDFLEVRKILNRKIPKIGVSFVRTKLNDHEYRAFVDYWKKIVDTVNVQNAQNPFAEGKFKNEEKKDLIMLSNTTNPPEKFRCPEPFKRMTVRGNGHVLGCCSFYAVDLIVGDWKKKSLVEIWNDDKMKELRKIHKDGEYYKNPICKQCIVNYAFLAP